MTEFWRPVLGYEDTHEVSDQGRVRTHDRTVRRSFHVMSIRGRVLKPFLTNGYASVKMRRDGTARTVLVHTLVLEAFVGPRPEAAEALHGPSGRLVNHLANLRWGTHSENMADRRRDGTDHEAAKTHCKHGHEFTPENTRIYRYPDGTFHQRCCRSCERIRSERRRNSLRNLTRETP